MGFEQELEALYKKAIELRAAGKITESEAVEGQAAAFLQQLKTNAAQHPNDPSITPLLYLAERDAALLGDHETVHEQLEHVLTIREKEYGSSHALTAEALARLAEFHFLAGHFGEAEPLYRRAIAIYEKNDVDQDPVYAKALAGLAQNLAALGQAAQADTYFQRAIDRPGSDEQGKRTLYFLLIYRAEGLEKLGRPAEAEVLRQQAVALLPKSNPGEFGFRP